MASDAKTASQSPRPALVPAKNGGKLYAGGVPGNKGGGRKPEFFYEKARELCNDPKVWEVMQAFARAGNVKPLEFAAQYTYGKPKETVQHDYDGEVVIRVEFDGA